VRTRLVAAGGVAAGAVAVVSAVVLTGAVSGPVNTGPLGGGPVNGWLCMPASARVPVSVAQDDLRNSTGSPILVEKLSLVSAHGLRLAEPAYLVPIVHPGSGYDLMLTGGHYPPTRRDLALAPDARWAERRALPMTMPPDRPGHSWNLVFGVERTAATGTADYQLQYEWQGNQYIWSAWTNLNVTDGPTQICHLPEAGRAQRRCAPLLLQVEP
jgi:hypothetical protein